MNGLRQLARALYAEALSRLVTDHEFWPGRGGFTHRIATVTAFAVGVRR
jgi:hypothetical protein